MSCRFGPLLLAAMVGFGAQHSAHAVDDAAALSPLTSADLWDDPEIDSLIHEGLGHNSDGDFDAASEVWKRLAEAAPHHPAANVHAADTLIWLGLFEDDDTSFDDAIVRESEEGVRKAEAWLEARPGDARAHLYLGQTLMTLGRLHGVRGRIYRAGSYGERARKECERALAIDPSLTDAKYPIGLYAYYASLIPDVFQWLSFLWFIPKGDAALGLQYLADVEQTGDLYRFTAAFYLSNIRAFHERSLDRPAALASVTKLHERHPLNSLIHFELVENLVLAKRYEDARREALVLESHPGTGKHDRGRTSMARVWRARAEMYLGRSNEAWRLLEIFADDGPAEPDWGNLWVQLLRGQIRDLAGQRQEAISHYQRIAALDLNPNFNRTAVLAAEGLEEPFRLPPIVSSNEPEASKPN